MQSMMKDTANILPISKTKIKAMLNKEEEKLVTLLANILVDQVIKISYENKKSDKILTDFDGQAKQL